MLGCFVLVSHCHPLTHQIIELLASGFILKPCHTISCVELALGGKKLTFSFRIRSLVLSPLLLPCNMCIKRDWPILFSLILPWQPCNAALLHNWIATLETVSLNSPNKEAAREERGKRKCLSVFCLVFFFPAYVCVARDCGEKSDKDQISHKERHDGDALSA